MAVVVDTRTEKEYRAKRIRGAVWAAYGEKSLKDVAFNPEQDDFKTLETLDRSKALIFNLLSSLATLVGGLLAYFALSHMQTLVPVFLARSITLALHRLRAVAGQTQQVVDPHGEFGGGVGITEVMRGACADARSFATVVV